MIQSGHHTIQLGCHMIQSGCHMVQLGCHVIQSRCHMMWLRHHIIKLGCHTVQLARGLIQLGHPVVELRGHMVQLRCGNESPKGQKRIEKLVGSCHGTSLSCEWSIFGVVSCLGGGWGWGVNPAVISQSQCAGWTARSVSMSMPKDWKLQRLCIDIRFRVETLLATRRVFSFHFGIVPSFFFPFLFFPPRFSGSGTETLHCVWPSRTHRARLCVRNVCHRQVPAWWAWGGGAQKGGATCRQGLQGVLHPPREARGVALKGVVPGVLLTAAPRMSGSLFQACAWMSVVIIVVVVVIVVSWLTVTRVLFSDFWNTFYLICFNWPG